MNRETTLAQASLFPSTRYQGSKRKLLSFLFDVFNEVEFQTVLDPFCGTGAVSYLLKCLGKSVTCSDGMHFNSVCAKALVENSGTRLGKAAEILCKGLPAKNLPTGFVERTFGGIFFEEGENRFIDQILWRINALSGHEKHAALFALFQACLAKRPYNLFHRANLYMRQNDVKRSFGNKVTWDSPFPELFTRYAGEADKAVFDSGNTVRAIQGDIADMDLGAHDLVYFDPPYMSAGGQGVDYMDYYHFLEGLCLTTDEWTQRLLPRYKHRPITGKGTSPFSKRSEIANAFEGMIGRTRGAVVVSYRSDGIPTIEQIAGFMKKHGKSVEIRIVGKYTYALSRNRKSQEIVLIGT